MALDVETSLPPTPVTVHGPADGSPISARLRTVLLEALVREGITVLTGLPTDPAELLRLGHSLGTPEPRRPLEPPPSPDEPLDWVANVYFRPETPDDEHKPFTHRASELQLHTARAAATARPRLFMMMMADPGRGDPAQDNGQSQFARVDDTVRILSRRHGPRKAQRLLSLLATTPISTEVPYPDEPVVEPILREVGDRWVMRYWENIHRHAVSAGLAPEALEALRLFDEALRAVRFEYVLAPGDVVLLDNERVCHARRAFPGWTTDEHGVRVPSSRLIYNLHVFSDLNDQGGRRSGV